MNSTGASRGIGLEIAKSLAHKGVNVAVAAKSATAHAKLPGTIHSTVEEINRIGEESQSGAKGLAIQLDVRDEKAVEDAIEQTVGKFGGLDYAVNNVSVAAKLNKGKVLWKAMLTALSSRRPGLCNQPQTNNIRQTKRPRSHAQHQRSRNLARLQIRPSSSHEIL